MSLAEISKLSLREKFQIMESIWGDLREVAEGFDTPQAHRDLLDARRQRAQSGEARIHHWDDVKNSFGLS
jgi:putative addiction module component (TIGR02574 family)